MCPCFRHSVMITSIDFLKFSLILSKHYSIFLFSVLFNKSDINLILSTVERILSACFFLNLFSLYSFLIQSEAVLKSVSQITKLFFCEINLFIPSILFLISIIMLSVANISTWFVLWLIVLASDYLSSSYSLVFIYYVYFKFFPSNLASHCLCCSMCYLSFLVVVLLCYLIVLVCQILMGKQRWLPGNM